MAGIMSKIKALVGVEEEEYEYEDYEEVTYDQRKPYYDSNREYGLGDEVRQSNRERLWDDQRERQPSRDRQWEDQRERQSNRDHQWEDQRERQPSRDRQWEEQREMQERRERQEMQERQDRHAYRSESARQRENVINMPGSNRLKELTTKFNIMVIEPKSFDECPRLVDSLKARKPVIVNLERIETETARKIFDFLSGATYAVNGDLQKIANNIFVFLPENVEVYTNTEQGNDQSPWNL